MKHFPPKRQFSKLLLMNFLPEFLTEKKTSNEQFNLCEAKIFLDEIMKSINSQTNGYPANDGLTAEFDKLFANELAPDFLDIYGSWGKLGTVGVISRTGIMSIKFLRIDCKKH